MGVSVQQQSACMQSRYGTNKCTDDYSSAPYAADTSWQDVTHLHVFELFFVSLEAFFGELFACVIAGVIAAMACRRHLVMVSACTLTGDRRQTHSAEHIQQLIARCVQRDVPCSAVRPE